MISGPLKVLIIRFSSFGDLTQALSVASRVKDLGQRHPEGIEVHWVTRQDLAPLVEHHPQVDKLWTLDRNEGLIGLIRLILNLKKQKFTHIYDAHNNLRSHLICWFLSPPLALTRVFLPPQILRKSQKRWKRFLLFRLRKNTYEMPFSGQRDLLEPLTKWGLSKTLPPVPQLFLGTDSEAKVQQWLQAKGLSKYVALAPSAAYELKRWPLSHWKELIRTSPNLKFVALGGASDQFINSLEAEFPNQVTSAAGLFDVAESATLIARSQALVANDTGLLHVAEQLGIKAVALMGPAPFGFPSRPLTKVLERNLPCRPCSKHGQGPCVNKAYFHECLVSISPQEVQQALRNLEVVS